MAIKINYRKPATLLWQDLSMITTGVGYLRGDPHFEGNLAEAVRQYYKLPRPNRSLARIRTEPQPGLKKTSLSPTDIEALKKRKDFPGQ